MARNGIAKGERVRPEGHLSARDCSVARRYSFEAGQAQKQGTQRPGGGREILGRASEPCCRPLLLSWSKGERGGTASLQLITSPAHRALLPSLPTIPEKDVQKWDGEGSRPPAWQTTPFLWRPHHRHLELHLPPNHKSCIKTHTFHYHSDFLFTNHIDIHYDPKSFLRAFIKGLLHHTFLIISYVNYKDKLSKIIEKWGILDEWKLIHSAPKYFCSLTKTKDALVNREYQT